VVGWLADCLGKGSSAGCVSGGMTGWVIMLAGWLTGCVGKWMGGWVAGWLTGWFGG